MDWIQNYDPFGSPLASTLVAAVPIVALLGLIVAGVSAPRAAAVGLTTALAVAVFGFSMPGDAALAAAAYGACFGLLPIGWIVFSAVFLFQLTVRSGQFEVVKQSVASISPDRRMQALLIAFCFGTFIEGAAGFGTPVAISAALMIGLGFSPLYAAGLALLANTSPVAFGGLGTPIFTLAQVSGISDFTLGQMAGRQLSLFSLIVPGWLVAVMSGWRGVKGCWPAILVSGGTFAGLQFLVSNYRGPALVAVIGGLGSLVALTVLLRFWQPCEVWRFPDETPHQVSPPESAGTQPRHTSGQVLFAWVPWILLSVIVFLWGDYKTVLNGGDAERPNALSGFATASVAVPHLYGRVYRTTPVVPVDPTSGHAADPEPAIYKFEWLSATGTGIFLAAVLSAFWLRIRPASFCLQFLETFARLRWALFTIACMLAIAFVTKFGGTDATLGLAFTKTGAFYPFFAPLLGWLGVALTGSDTSSNALFGSLQKITAELLHFNPVLIVASNSTGGVMGKMIDAQSIVVAAAATEQSGGEGKILRFVLPHSIVLACLVGLLTLAQAYVLRWMVP